MSFGLKLKSSFATLANVTVQPKAPAPAPAIASPILGKSKILPENMFSKVIESKATKFILPTFDFRLVKDFLNIRVDSRYNDELPRSTAKFTPFEELSGMASTRPEILSVSEFKPIFTNDGYGLTSAGAFMDAQVKLMNLRHEAVALLINDLKKDPELAEQLDQIEGDFILHVQNLKSRADFLVTLQKYIERITRMLDLRDSSAVVDAASLVTYYFASVFTNANTAQATLPTYTYADLLSQHGFNKSNVAGFSSSKVFLQTLYEARKILRAGSDELVSVDPSLASRDSDAVTLNKRAYRDPHVDLERVRIPTYEVIAARGVHGSDTKLNNLLQELDTHYRSLDKVFSHVSSEEIAYTLKLRTLAREVSYSHALSNTATTALLADYGYPVSSELGNQQLFDAVYGQLGTRVTDNRAGANPNSVVSIASKVDGDRAILTYEVDYLEDDQGSVYSPGASYYVANTLRPNSNAAFSIERPSELVTRMSSVVDKYIDFIGRFNLLPRVGNVITNQLASSQFAMEPVAMANALYSIFIEDSSGTLKTDCAGNPLVDFFGEAATHSALRANLLMYFSCVTNVSNDGLADAAAARSLAGQDLRQEAQNRAADAERQNERVSPTVDKLVRNCVNYYKQMTGDTTGATKVENALRNFGEQGPLARAMAFVKACNDVQKTTMSAGHTRYSRLSDASMVAQSVQLVLDTARRYAYNRVRVNKASQINSNLYTTANVASLAVRATQSVQTLSSRVATQALGKTSLAANAFTTGKHSAALGVSYFVSKLPLKQAVVARLEREENLAIRTALAPLHALRLVRDNLKDFVLYLQRSENVKVLNDILNVVGDRKLVELLGDKGQVRLLYDTVETVTSKIIKENNAGVTDITDVSSLTRSARPDDDLKIFDDSFITSRTANLIKAAYANAKYSPDRGSNIRVISFGLPHGFTTRLHNKFKLSSFAEQMRSKPQQNDVVIADVYKIDVRYPDIIFKPVPKVFELSRFAVRDESKYRPAQVGARLDDVLDSVPTRDYSDIGNPRMSYGDQGITPDYAFMTHSDFKAMHRNTVMSYLHEISFRLLTGIPMSERELYVADPDETDRPAPFVAKAILQNTTQKVFKLPVTSNLKLNFSLANATQTVSYFSAVQAAKASSSRASTKVGGIIKQAISVSYSPRITRIGRSHAEAAAHVSKKKTVYTDRDLAAKYVMSPKLFERVFFIDVDPDDFEVDREETFKSDVGRSTFAQLQQAGEIEVESETLGSNVREAYFLKDHRSEKQMTFEKYFVVLRAYSPLTTRTR